MNISIIIPNYNGEKLLEVNIPIISSILNTYREYHFEVIIVDDASADNSVGILESIREKNNYKNVEIKIVSQLKNKGFSTTVNNGVSHASYEIVILLNSDVVPEKDFLPPLISHFSDQNIFAVGCMDKSVEGEKVVLRGRGVGEWRRGFLVHRKGEVDRTDTLWVSGGSCALRKKIFERLSGFDTIYNPFYWEDIDLSYRAQKAGYTIVFEPKSVVIHHHSKGAIKKHFSDSSIKKIAYRNQIIFVWKNISEGRFLVSHFLWLPYYLVKSVFSLDIDFISGLFLAMVKIPDIIKRRKSQSKTYTRFDKDIIQYK